MDWRIKFKADVISGVIGSVTTLLYDHYTQSVLAFSLVPFVKDIISFLVTAFLVISHYPVNGVLIVFLILVIFVLLWLLLQIHGITVDIFVQFHLFGITFFLTPVWYHFLPDAHLTPQ